jgi:ribosomal protein L7/L12
MVQVEVVGWRKGFLSISFIKLVREAGARKLSLAEAKALVDEMINGRKFALQFESEDEAHRFVLAAEELGAISSRPVLPSGSEVTHP